jgi:uncharacterized protein YjiS (DUF1127 family)
MAYVQSTDIRNTLINSALSAFRALGNRFEQHRAFLRTRDALSGLSEAELHDLGLHRAEIDRVAMEASIGAASR